MISTNTIPNVRCRVRIVDDITGRMTTVESPRDRADVWFDLARVVRKVNRRRDETLRASLHMLPGIIVLHWHAPSWWGNDFSEAILDAARPMYEAEKLIWKGGSQA